MQRFQLFELGAVNPVADHHGSSMRATMRTCCRVASGAEKSTTTRLAEAPRNAVTCRHATTRCLPGISTYSVMALLFDRTSQREGGRLFDKSNQPAAHTTGCSCDNDVDHPRPHPLLLELDEACIL